MLENIAYLKFLKYIDKFLKKTSTFRFGKFSPFFNKIWGNY